MRFLWGLLFTLFANCIFAEKREFVVGGEKYPLRDICQEEIPKKVDVKMHASLVYWSMAAFFDRNSVGKKGFVKFFTEKSKKQQEHAQKLISYLNSRGGALRFFNISMPDKYTWENGLEAVTDALNLDIKVHDELYQLHEIGGKPCSDAHLRYFLNEQFFTEQIKSIDTLKSYVSILQGMEGGVGEYLFDRQLLERKTEL